MQVFQTVSSFMRAKDKVIFNPTTHLSHVEEINKAAMADGVRRSKLVLAALRALIERARDVPAGVSLDGMDDTKQLDF